MNPIAPQLPSAVVPLAPVTLAVRPAFVLLFAVTPDAAAQQVVLPKGLFAIPEEIAQSYRGSLDAMQQRLLGEPYLEARRLTRTAVGRLQLLSAEGSPAFADVHLVKHKSGAAVWVVWLLAPVQPTNVTRWVAWLDMADPNSLARRIWPTLSPASADSVREPEMMLPLAVSRCATCSLDALLDASGMS